MSMSFRGAGDSSLMHYLQLDHPCKTRLIPITGKAWMGRSATELSTKCREVSLTPLMFMRNPLLSAHRDYFTKVILTMSGKNGDISSCLPVQHHCHDATATPPSRRPGSGCSSGMQLRSKSLPGPQCVGLNSMSRCRLEESNDPLRFAGRALGRSGARGKSDETHFSGRPAAKTSPPFLFWRCEAL